MSVGLNVRRRAQRTVNSGVAEDVLRRQCPAAAVRSPVGGQQTSGHEDAQAPLHRARRATQVRRELADSGDTGLAVGRRGAPLLGGGDGEQGVQVDGAGVPTQPAQGRPGHHAEQAEAVGARRGLSGEAGGRRERGAV
jgi:hypothetical protein